MGQKSGKCDGVGGFTCQDQGRLLMEVRKHTNGEGNIKKHKETTAYLQFFFLNISNTKQRMRD